MRKIVWRLNEWLDLQDTDSRKASRGLAGWLALSLLVLGVVSLGAWVPVTRDLFALDPHFPLAFYGALLIVPITVYFYERKPTARKRTVAVIEAVFALGMELFVASLVSFSALPGAAVYAGFAVFITTWYGHLLRVGPRYPLHALGSLLVYVVAVALNPTTEHIAIFAMVAPTALIGKLLLGSWALEADRHRAEAERLRAAVQAQMLADQSGRIAALADTLVDVLARNHDVRNAVMAAHVDAETLQSLAERESFDQSRGMVVEIARNLESSLDRVIALLHDISRLGRDELAEVVPEHVRVQPVLARIVADVQRRFPSILIDLEGVDGNATARVAGGEVTLARIVENALVNACEGNGTEHAHHVAVRVESDAKQPYLRLRVKDDGPGFAPELVSGPIRGFVTTKDGGTGLGLYTLERLARASGGRVSRENDSGAHVTIELLRSDTTSSV